MNWSPNPNRQRAGARIDREARENFVYYLFGTSGTLLYIGCTRCPESRWRNHGYANPQLVEATASCKMRGPYTRSVARSIEKAAILAEDPPFNLAPGGRRKRAALAGFLMSGAVA